MRVAQGLYERGYITYMRTDSTALSDTAVSAARRQAAELFGSGSIPDAPRRYKSKAKNAQEAHEAIRPAGDDFRRPADLAGELHRDDLVLYELIWKRTLASQMIDARKSTTTIRLAATARDGEDVEFTASGTVILVAGFLAAYEEGRDDESTRDGETRLPKVTAGERVDLESVTASGHETKPPARFTEASLVKRMEEQGIGRPSTYASIIGTIQDRGYAFKRGSALVPTWLGFAVVRLLEEHFAELVDYAFTARMEEILDLVAGGEQPRIAVLKRFYTGDGEGGEFPGLTTLVSGFGDIDARANATFAVEGSDVPLRVGRYGPYLDADGRRVNVPEDLAPDELTAAKVAELLSVQDSHALGIAPDTGRPVVAKSGRYGPYVTEELTPEEDELKGRKRPKPRTASLLSSMSLDTVTLDQAMRLLSLPRLVGAHPTDGQEITAHNGRFGPYITHAGESRSLPDEEAIFTITTDEAVVLLAQPKQRRGRQADPGVPVGTDPATQQPIVLKNGRFGPYVTDGETNASLRTGDDPATLTLDRAAELLADRRAAGPPKKRAKKAAKRSTGAKKSTTAKKAPAKKTTTRKKAAAKKTS